ncbi:UNVERIFIED_CONTAM: hypothetical protein FKN15_015830 [Acipenser sinensis]
MSPVNGMPDLGASSNIVLKLANIIPQHQNFKLYHDNWFTSIGLEVELAKRGIYCLGTVRSNRLKECTLKTDAEFKKLGRGSYDEKLTSVDGVQLIASKWQDNQSVTLLSTFSGIYPTSSVKRWDKKAITKIDVQCPSSVLMYNTSVGGTDLMYSLIALYHNKIRSKKWYLHIFFHFMDRLHVNAWLLYRRDHQAFKLTKREEFKTSLAETLCKKGANVQGKRGCPCFSNVEEPHQKKRHHPKTVILNADVRKDETAHWPRFVEKQERCKNSGCDGQARVKSSSVE